MNSPEATVVLKSPDGAWTTIGTETGRGIVPEGITVTVNESGPDVCSFSLRREASVPYPDLLAFSQADIYVGSTLVWGGRVWEAPLSDHGPEPRRFQAPRGAAPRGAETARLMAPVRNVERSAGARERG
jgi:hypothetical protein